MSEDCPETDIGFDAPRLTSSDKLRRAECFYSRATLDDLLSDEVMAPVLRPGTWPRLSRAHQRWLVTRSGTL